jgi:tetratricopeptide (TPR) repeat protein
MTNSPLSTVRSIRVFTLLLCSVFGAGVFAPAFAASEANLKRYAEAVDYLDRWRGDREALDAAHERLTELLIDEPEFAPAHVEMARWYLMNSQNYLAALRSLERAEALDPDFPGTFVLRGYIFERQERLDEALVSLDRAEAIGTDNPWLQLNRAAVYEKQGRTAEALALYESVFEAHRDDPKAWPSAKVGLIELHQRLGDLNAVESVFLRASAMNTHDPSDAKHYVEWLGNQGRLDEALAMAREARKRWQDPALAHQLIGLQFARASRMLAADRDGSRQAFGEAAALAAELGIPVELDFDAWIEQLKREGALPR